MILHYIDIIGTFVFALSGVSAGIRRNYDIFGILVLALITACGGGVIRDVCLGATPPAGLVNTIYLYTVVAALVLGMYCQKIIIKMEKPTLWLDALGLGFFAAFGANKTYQYTQSIHLSIILGCVSAVGGGCIRDILVGKSPTIFTKEIYASAALIGAAIELLGSTGIINQHISIWLAIFTCTLIRIISMHFNINLPSVRSYMNNPDA